jgi:colanic acid/amylovoran biosynthesis glycosyltransferase
MNLFLFTNSFPCKKSEPFLVNEFEFTKQRFDYITVIPLYGDLIDSHLQQSDSLKILQPLLGSFSSKNKLFFKGIFNTSSIKWHVNEFLQQRIFLSPKKTYWFFVSVLITRLTLSSKQYKQLINQIYATENPILYFYWADNFCWIIPYLKEKLTNKEIKIVIRLHRTDLYEYLKNDYAPLRRYIFSLADVIVPISKDGENYLSAKYPFICNKLFLSRLGVFDNGLNPINTQNTKHIVSVSSIVEVKRVHLIFETLQKSTTKLVWHHFGDGSKANQLNDLIKKKRVGLEIKLNGFVDNKNLIKFYQSQPVDLFLNVSASEGLPVSIMEALSFGIPVIATDVGGTSELVNENNGQLIPANFDINELAYSIECMLKLDPLDLELLRKNARTVFEENFFAKKNYNLFYEKLLSSK